MAYTKDHRPLWERVVPCRSCKAKIVWFTTEAGRQMPVDAGTVEVGDVRYTKGKHMPHFATCPEGKRWTRKRNRPTPDFETPGIYRQEDGEP